MNIHHTQISSLGYKPFEELEHDDLYPFIQKYMKAKTNTSRAFSRLNIAFLILLVGLFLYGYMIEDITFIEGLRRISYGFAITLFLIPIHEYIHVWAYKYCGAKNTSLGANLKKFYFMALADKFVCDSREFRIIALAPFLTISIISIVLLLILPSYAALTISSVLLVHTACCSGDFGLLSFFEAHKNQNVITYDDLDEKKTYFFKR